MKNHFLIFASLLVIALFSQCKKDDDDKKNNNVSCNSISNDEFLIEGKKYAFASNQATNCAQTNIGGASWYTHFRTLIYQEGTTLIMPDINITLGSVPANGTTTTFTLDNGAWQANTTLPSDGKATFRMNNYQDQYGYSQYWFSDGQSGTFEVTMGNDGKPTFNFTEIKLVRSGGSLDDRLVVCGKNIVCH